MPKIGLAVVAILQNDFKPLVPRVTNHLLPLVDQMFGRALCLNSQNIKAFNYDQDFINEICNGIPEEVE
jgi:hypothetical protein